MIKLLIFDVDGCLSSGEIIYANYKNEIVESKAFSVKDGLAIKRWNQLEGKKSAIITGRKSAIVETRAKELDITYLYQGIHHKKAILDELMEHEKLTYEEIAILGDDLNDYGMLNTPCLTFCPQDASSYIREIADHTLTKNGGKGVAREMIEHILDRDAPLKKAYLSAYIG